MSEAIEKLAELLRPPNGLDGAARRLQSARWEEKIRLLVLGWPSLAATLAELLEESGHRVPMALKRAYQIMEEEARNG